MEIQADAENGGFLVDAALQARLAVLYGEPGRHYHTLAHIAALLAIAARHRGTLADAAAVDAAIWFHDAIYDSRRNDNEARSAGLAVEWLAGRTTAARLARIAALIEATATHTIPDFPDTVDPGDAALFLDMDLSILGAAPAEFDAYEAAVRREYAWVDEASWRAGRRAVLSGFAARPRIFRSAVIGEALEASARANIARSIARLG